MEKDYFAKVARTAYGTAHARTFTDIPFSQEVFQQLTKILEENGEEGSQLMDTPLIPHFEARYLMIDYLLEQHQVDQVLEVASGLSMRGLNMVATAPRPYPCYVEVDQAVTVDLKKRVLAGFKETFNTAAFNKDHSNWHLEVGDALNLDSLTKASAHFRHSPIVIVNEGLLVYFTHDEKAKYARNVRQLLRKFGGVWLTSDIMTADSYSNVPGWLEMKAAWYERLGRNLDDCNFLTMDEAREFYERLGFSVEVRWLSEVLDQLVSPERLNLSRTFVREMLERRPLFIMRAQ